jgi:integrase
VDALKPGSILWDMDVNGFGVRCQRRNKVYFLKASIRGKQRWLTIGPHGSPWTPEKARTEAKRKLGDIADGKDPAKIREAAKNNPTVADLCDRYYEDYAKDHKKPSSAATDKANIENHVKPLLGMSFISDVTLADIDRFKRAVKSGKSARKRNPEHQGGPTVTGGPGVANRCLALVSKMFNLAERWGLRPDNSNPCRHIDRYPEGSRERFLSEKELAALAGVLVEAEQGKTETPYSIAALRLLLFTGARLGEILSLEWAHVDFERTMLLLPDSKTGKKAIYLSAPALDVLSNLPRMKDNPFVICGEKDGAHLVNLQKPWGRIRKRAGLEDVRIHDLRHSFASVAASGGLSLPMIGKLLGHTQSVTTQRYAHLAADPLRAANEAIGQRIAAVMKGGKEGGEVVSLPQRKI